MENFIFLSFVIDTVWLENRKYTVLLYQLGCHHFKIYPTLYLLLLFLTSTNVTCCRENLVIFSNLFFIVFILGWFLNFMTILILIFGSKIQPIIPLLLIGCAMSTLLLVLFAFLCNLNFNLIAFLSPLFKWGFWLAWMTFPFWDENLFRLMIFEIQVHSHIHYPYFKSLPIAIHY